MTYAIAKHIGHVGDNYETDMPPLSNVLPYQTFPLGQLTPPPPLPGRFSLANINIRQVLLVVVVLVVAVLIMRAVMKLTRGATKVERNAVVSRLSTKELAQRLYDRLESKGSRTNNTTMRSLERLGR